MVSFKLLVAAAGLASQALAQRRIPILAIQDLNLEDSFVFEPNSVTANVGDILEFHFAPTAFLPSSHSVAQGTFEKACTPLAGGFFSGVVTGPPITEETPLGEAENVFQVLVNSTAPMVFYCATGQHCTRGMYGVVNPSSTQNLASYKATIPVNTVAVAPVRVAGGQFVANPGVINRTAIAATAGAGVLQASIVGVVGAMGFAMLMS